VVISVVSWLAFSLSIGVFEGVFFAYGIAHQIQERMPFNKHIPLTGLRIVVGLICLAPIWKVGFGWLVLVAISYGLMFPFLHNGSYYTTRRIIDMPLYHWFTSKNQSDAKINLGAWKRTIAFISGCGLWWGCLLLT